MLLPTAVDEMFDKRLAAVPGEVDREIIIGAVDGDCDVGRFRITVFFRSMPFTGRVVDRLTSRNDDLVCSGDHTVFVTEAGHCKSAVGTDLAGRHSGILGKDVDEAHGQRFSIDEDLAGDGNS